MAPPAPRADGRVVSAGPYERYRAVARRIIAHTRKRGQAWHKLVELCDDIGHRLSGSPNLERAVKWAVQTLKSEGHEKVHTEQVMVPRWVRGPESLALLAPRQRDLPLLGLGLSVGTPPGGIEAEVVVVDSEKSLKQLGTTVKGKIVLFNHRMPPYDPVKGSGYGRAAYFRVHGASLAARLGARAVLVRSVTARSLRTPHTGMMSYKKGVPRIPAAAITLEDADLLARFQARKIPIRVQLKMAAQTRGQATSHNVLAEIRGREKPDEIVVIGAHLDSWDAGQGAHDDGVGVAMTMEALAVLRRLKLRPRRTVRLVLWTAEEQGIVGAKQYARDHAAELERHVAGIEADAGGFRPTGLGWSIGPGQQEKVVIRRLKGLARLVTSVATLRLKKGWSGGDLSPLKKHRVLRMALVTEGRRYFDVHHSPADTVDKVDPADLTAGTAIIAVLAYVLADQPTRP